MTKQAAHGCPKCWFESFPGSFNHDTPQNAARVDDQGACIAPFVLTVVDSFKSSVQIATVTGLSNPKFPQCDEWTDCSKFRAFERGRIQDSGEKQRHNWWASLIRFLHHTAQKQTPLLPFQGTCITLPPDPKPYTLIF